LLPDRPDCRTVLLLFCCRTVAALLSAGAHPAGPDAPAGARPPAAGPLAAGLVPAAPSAAATPTPSGRSRC